MKTIYALLLGLVITALVGCAFPGSIVPNTTTADELTKKLGRPSVNLRIVRAGFLPLERQRVLP